MIWLCLILPVLIAVGVWLAVTWAAGKAEERFNDYDDSEKK